MKGSFEDVCLHFKHLKMLFEWQHLIFKCAATIQSRGVCRRALGGEFVLTDQNGKILHL
jgi:hypothetical protein